MIFFLRYYFIITQNEKSSTSPDGFLMFQNPYDDDFIPSNEVYNITNQFCWMHAP